ncbi:hypothetical protein FB446DRAFT_387552 [Lentinula raphanica]|nr:hypothetical protein FB446DRAFT_387552 [Lentinula raphanica]
MVLAMIALIYSQPGACQWELLGISHSSPCVVYPYQLEASRAIKTTQHDLRIPCRGFQRFDTHQPASTPVLPSTASREFSRIYRSFLWKGLGQVPCQAPDNS